MTNVYMVQIYLNNLKALKTYVNKLDVNVKFYDLDKIKAKINEQIEKIEWQLKDISTIMSFRRCYADHKNLYNVIKEKVKTAETLEKLIEIKTYINMLHEEDFEELRLYDLSNAADNHYYGNYRLVEMPIDYTRSLYRAIKNTNELNIFMPECFYGTTIASFASSKDKTFGNASSYVNDARSRMTRVIKGGLKGSHITNNYFDVVFMVPEVQMKLEQDPFGKIREPKEKVFIKNCIKYCRQNGLLVMTIPVTRLDANFAFYLSKILSDNTVVTKIPDDPMNRITIMGQKQITNKIKPELYERLKYINYDTIPLTNTLQPTFEIPTEQLILDFFRGSTLDTEDILEALQPALINNFLDNQTQPLIVKDQSPLLPFNIGQVGLVLTSGCLDGVVEEVDGVYHVIKGMTTKLTTTQTEVSEENNKVKSTETISNQVKINVFTADGEFISLG